MISPIGQKPEFKSKRRVPPSSVTRHKFAAAVAMIVFTLPAIAREDASLTLAEAERLALAAEPGQQALQARAAALEERAVVAGELPDPMLRIGLNNFPVESGGFRTEGMTHAAVGLRQAFPAGKTRSLSALRIGLLADEMTENADARGRNVLNAVRSAWLDSYYWEQARDLVIESRPFFGDLATITRSLYAVGRKSQQDVLRADLELSRLDDRLIEIDRQRSRAQAELGEWIGINAARPLARELPSWEQLPLLEPLQETLQRHPTLRAADAQIEAGNAGVDLAEQRSKPAWAVDLGYSYREGTLPSGEPRSDFISLGVTVGLPFFRKKSVDSTLSAALQERAAARAAREQTLRAMQRQLVAEYAHWQDLTRRVSLYKSQILGQAEGQAEAALLAYQSDKGDFAEVMRAYIDDLNTRIEHIRLQVERAQTYAVLANLGGLSQ